MPQYKIGENVFDEKDIIIGAQEETLSVDEYVKKYNIEVDGVSTLESQIIRKPKTPKEATESAFVIKNSIDKDNPAVKKALAEKYFDLANVERPKEVVKRPTYVEGPFGIKGRSVYAGTMMEQYKNDYETDLKNYFATKVPFAGPDKYEAYNRYRETGEFDVSLVSSAEIAAVVKEEQKRQMQLYIADIDNDDIRKVASANLMDGVFDDMDPTSINPKTGNLWVDEYTTALTEDRKILYPKDFQDPDAMMKERGTPMYGPSEKEKEAPFFNFRKTPILKGKGKANIVLKDYLDFKINEILNLKSDYQETTTKFNNTVTTEYIPEIEKLVGQISDLNLTPNSSEQEKSRGLALYNQYESVLNEYRVALNNQKLTAASINLTAENFLETTAKLDDAQFVAQAFMLDYSMEGGMALSIEKGLVDMLGLGVKALDYLEEIPEALLNMPNKVAFGGTPSGVDPIDIEFFGNIHKNKVISYQESLQQYTEASRPLNIRWQDVKFSGPDANFGEAANQLFANNVFSIASALTYGGVIKAGGKAVVAPATKYLTRLFFGLEGGAKLAEMEISQKNAQSTIDFYTGELANATTEDQRLAINKQIDLALKQLNYTEFQKAFSAITYGGIAAYAEKFGTMSYVQKLALLSKSDITGITIGNALKGAGGFGYNTGIEYIEEAFTQVGHNLVDYGVLGENKSLIDGIDAEFNMNVLFSTMAIQGPSTSANVFNAVRSEISTAQEIKENQKRSAAFAEIAKQIEVLRGKRIRTVDGRIVEGEKTDIELYLESEAMRLLREAQVQDAAVFADVSNMSNEDIFSLFEAQRKKRELRQRATSIGSAQSGQKYNKTAANKIKAIQQEIDGIDQEISELRGKTKKDQKEKVDNVIKQLEQVDQKLKPKAEDYFFLGKFYESVSMTLGLGGSVIKVKNVEEALDILKEKGATEEQIAEYRAAFTPVYAGGRGANGSFFGNDIIAVEDNVISNILQAPINYEKSAMAFTVFHELTHLNDSRIKLFEDIEMRGMNDAMITDIENLIKEIQSSNPEVYNKILNRLNIYKAKGKDTYLRELTPLLAELQDAGLINEGRSLSVSLKLLLNSAINKYFGGKQPMYFKFNSAQDINAYVASFRKGVRDNNLIVAGTTPEGDPIFSESIQRTPEKLIRQIKKLSKLPNFKDNPQYRKDYAELLAQYNALALTAINFSEEYGDIPRKNVVSALSIYLPGLIKRFTPTDPKTGKKRKFSTFVTANIAPKDDTIYEEAKIQAIRDSVKLDDPNVKDVAGDINDTANTQDTFVQKIDMFEDFSIVSTKSNDIKSKIKVKEGDSFKEVIDNNAGQVGEIIFDIPADKIMKGGANLSLVTKYKEGMPIPAEAQSIQRVFNAGENASKFIKTLPLLNVTRKTADINKIGENIDVPRDIYGRAIGIKGLVMDYFYEDYVDPRATSADRAVKQDAETSPGGRSLGLTTQTNVKILKPEFRNPTPETIEKFKRDLGITPKGEQNIFNRDIGQFLKSNAKALSIGVSLSGAQRKLEQADAAKTDIAKVTAAQGRAAFSESFRGEIAQSVDAMYMLDGGAIKLTFEGDLDRVDKILKKFIDEGTYKFKNEKEIRNYFKDFEVIVIKNLPRNMFMGALNSFLKPSKRILPKKGVEEITLEDGRTVTINDFFDEMRADLVKRSKKDYKGKNKVVFGTEFKGEGAKYVYGRTYGSIYGTTAKEVEKSFYDGTREKQNAIFASMHEQFMARVNASIRSNNKNAKIWGNYFSLVGQDTEHPWRMGAEYVLFSKNPKGYEGKLYEWEHAMMATRSYLYLLETSLEQINGEYLDFDRAYKLVMENYKLIALDNYDDKMKLTKAGRQKSMGKGWQFLVNTWLDRYFHPEVAAFLGGIQPKSLLGDGRQTAAKIYGIKANGENIALGTDIEQRNLFSEAAINARGYNENTKSRGMSTFDFDETLIIDGKNFITATGPDGDVIKISSGKWPIKGPKLMDEGYTFDFKDFVNVRGGTEGPLLQKMKNQISKYGPSNVFVLTARMQESDTAIHGWLKTQGINIPIENITGLGNSTGEAKALWMLNKFAEGYNDMYFVDDALPNVKAVKNILDQLDIKSKVVQAKINFSEGLSGGFNNILEDLSGIDANKRFSAVKGRKRGRDKGKFRFFIPPSHEDFVGLLYNFLGKGEQGNRHRDFFEKSLIRPLNTAFRELNAAKQAIANDFKNLKRLNPEVKKQLNKSIKETKDDYTYADAIRVYLWNKAGYDIPGLSKSDQDLLVAIVRNDQAMRSFAEAINTISRQKDYVKPTEEWEIGDIRTDLIQATDGVNRAPFFVEFNNNVEEIFSQENLNKVEAIYGENVREALEDMIYRISTGTRRPTGTNKQVNRFLDYLQASIGGVMFFNMRSSILQQLSVVNFLNFEDNNIFAAAKAFANQKQYWKDWSMIFNSDMLKQRRGGLTMDVNYQDIASYAAQSKQPVRAIIKRLLALGFTPTQISDSMAIASGGATFYRNRVNKYLKEGLSQKEAETKAFEDFQIVAESTQQSARPDMTSSQQNSVLGWFILGFQNVTSQYNRIIKKSGSDLINRRISPPYSDQTTSDMANISRILYYGMIQNIVFYTLQTALFAALFNDNDDDEEFLKKRGRVLNGTVDSLLRGSGVAGAVVSTIKNAAFAFISERTKTYNPDESNVLVELLNVSPPMGIKARKVVGAEKTLNYDMKVIQAMKTFDIDNPVWSAATSYTEALTTLPVNRLYKKVQNLREAANRDNTNMQRLFLLFGWSKWNLGIKDPELEKLRKQVKRKKKRRSFK